MADSRLPDQPEKVGATGDDSTPETPQQMVYRRAPQIWPLMNDLFHPNGAGHALLALEAAETLGLESGPERDRVLPQLRAQLIPAR